MSVNYLKIQILPFIMEFSQFRQYFHCLSFYLLKRKSMINQKKPFFYCCLLRDKMFATISFQLNEIQLKFDQPFSIQLILYYQLFYLITIQYQWIFRRLLIAFLSHYFPSLIQCLSILLHFLLTLMILIFSIGDLVVVLVIQTIQSLFQFLYAQMIKSGNLNRQCQRINTYSPLLKRISKNGQATKIQFQGPKQIIGIKKQTLILTQGISTLIIKGEVDILLKTMKRFTIQEDFKQKFQLVRKLGQGSFAKVYSARDKLNEAACAVKIFEKSLFQSDCDKKSLLKEIQVLRVLNHNSTIHLLELYESSNFIYLVTELLKGGSLNYYLEKHSPLSEKETSQIIYQLLSAIKYINHCGIFHQDLKPDNIMFKEKNNLESLCITDFGLADFYNSEGKYLFNRCGSVGFVAPEVLHDEIYDYKIDLYSIGIIMYNAISGSQPFEGDSQSKVYQNYIGHSLIKGLLQPNPIQRLDVGQALKHTWFFDQDTNQFKIFAIKKRQSVQNKNLIPFIPQYSPGLSPRSPFHQSGQSKQTLLQQIGPKKRVSNFQPDEEFQLTIPTERYEQNNKFLKEQVRKSIFKHLEPLK